MDELTVEEANERFRRAEITRRDAENMAAELRAELTAVRYELAHARDGYVPNSQVIPFRLLAKWLIWLDTHPGRLARRQVSVEDIICKAKDAVGLVERIKNSAELPISGSP